MSHDWLDMSTIPLSIVGKRLSGCLDIFLAQLHMDCATDVMTQILYRFATRTQTEAVILKVDIY